MDTAEAEMPDLEMPEGEGYTLDGKIAEMMAGFKGRYVEEKPDGTTVSMRFYPASNGDNAYTEYLRFSDDFRVIFVNNLLFGSDVDKLRGEDWIKFHFRHTGRGAFLFGSDFLVNLESPICTVRLQPKGLDEGHWYGDDEERLWVTIYCTRSLLLDDLGLNPNEFPGSLRRFLKGGKPEPFFSALVMTPQMRRVVSDFGNACRGNLRRILVRAMAQELISLTVQALGRNMDGNEATGLKPVDVKRLHEARDILEANIANPPSVPELAAQIGINRTKLRAGFKKLFGNTIFEFCKEQRLDTAWSLLEVEGMMIGQVAEATGYEYDANFSTAFKKHFGIMPKDVRKGSAS